MSKYKVGDKIVLTVTSTNEMGCLPYYVLNDDLIVSKQEIDKYAEPLSTYTEPLETKIENLKKKLKRWVEKCANQSTEITRLLTENKKLKNKEQELTRERNQLMGRCGGLSAARIKEFNNGRLAGQNEVWELARKITCQPINGGFKRSEFEEIFGDSYISDIFERYTYPEAASKVAEWEKERDKIKVGDVVSREGLYGVVKSVSDDWLNGITASGISFQWLKRKCTKTGRHIDIDSFLKQIGEEQE